GDTQVAEFSEPRDRLPENIRRDFAGRGLPIVLEARRQEMLLKRDFLDHVGFPSALSNVGWAKRPTPHWNRRGGHAPLCPPTEAFQILGLAVLIPEVKSAIADFDWRSIMRRLAASALALLMITATAPADDIVLRGMGSLHVGGRIVEIHGKPVREIVRVPGGPSAKLDPNGQYHVGQMYAQYFLPKNRNGKAPRLI